MPLYTILPLSDIGYNLTQKSFSPNGIMCCHVMSCHVTKYEDQDLRPSHSHHLKEYLRNVIEQPKRHLVIKDKCKDVPVIK
jgi:hypothetical protein